MKLSLLLIVALAIAIFTKFVYSDRGRRHRRHERNRRHRNRFNRREYNRWDNNYGSELYIDNNYATCIGCDSYVDPQYSNYPIYPQTYSPYTTYTIPANPSYSAYPVNNLNSQTIYNTLVTFRDSSQNYFNNVYP